MCCTRMATPSTLGLLASCAAAALWMAGWAPFGAGSHLSGVSTDATAREKPPAPNAKVEHLIFLAMHEILPTDEQLIRHYAQQVRRAQLTAQLWVLLFRQPGAAPKADAALVARWRALDVPVCPWSQEDVHARFARAAGRRSSGHSHADEKPVCDMHLGRAGGR